MNKRLVVRILGAILLVEALAMLPAFIIALCYGEGDALPLLLSIMILLAVGLPMRLFAHPESTNLRPKEGFAVVGLSWIVLSFFGAFPLYFSGVLPKFYDAFFEAVSGFTTTGATVLTKIEGQPHGIMFWRSFTHWIGGMGVLVLALAILPKLTGRTAHLVRAESPGPSLSKIVPKMGDTAKILYMIYTIMTILMFAALLLAGLTPYDAALHAIGTAGTGGFSNYASSIGAFHSATVEIIVTVFMFLFGINLSLFYSLAKGRVRELLRSEELRWYVTIDVIATLFITAVMLPTYGDLGTSLRYAAFQVATITSTSGFATTDFNLWPVAAKAMLFVLMFIGSCAGSTAGGMKVVRIALMTKQSKREISRTIHPRRVQVVRFEGRGVDEDMLHQVSVFAFVYIALILMGTFAISLEGKYDIETNLTAAITCVSNVGPGFGAVGPAGGFSGYGWWAKLVSSVLMLAGRLELFPILILFDTSLWKKS